MSKTTDRINRGLTEAIAHDPVGHFFAVFSTARLWHAQGLLWSPATSVGRFMGTNLTALAILVGAVATTGRGFGAW